MTRFMRLPHLAELPQQLFFRAMREKQMLPISLIQSFSLFMLWQVILTAFPRMEESTNGVEEERKFCERNLIKNITRTLARLLRLQKKFVWQARIQRVISYLSLDRLRRTRKIMATITSAL